MVDDNADTDEGTVEPAASGGSLLRTGLTGIGLFAVVLAAQVAAPPINRMLYGDPSALQLAVADGAEQAAEDAVDEPTPAPQPDPVNLDPPIYAPLDPPLVVSLASADGGNHYLQMSVQAMARDQKSIDAIKTHAPALRNNFLFLIATHSVENLSSLEGKEQLRAEMREEARTVLVRNTGDPALEELYFTSFVIQ
jgi:flagellar protein FliL